MIWLMEIFKDLPRRTASDKVLHDQPFYTDGFQNVMNIKVNLLQCFMNV